jgi:hypothetical protein
MPPRKRPPEQRKAAETASRVRTIAEVMRRGDWIRGKSALAFAERWGISVKRAEQLSVEAWRLVCLEADSADAMRPEIAQILRQNLERADVAKNFRAIATLADAYTKIIGARAPERHEHAIVIAQFDSLNRTGKLEWIDKRIEKLKEARAALAEARDD